MKARSCYCFLVCTGSIHLGRQIGRMRNLCIFMVVWLFRIHQEKWPQPMRLLAGFYSWHPYFGMP